MEPTTPGVASMRRSTPVMPEAPSSGLEPDPEGGAVSAPSGPETMMCAFAPRILSRISVVNPL